MKWHLSKRRPTAEKAIHGVGKGERGRKREGYMVRDGEDCKKWERGVKIKERVER